MKPIDELLNQARHIEDLSMATNSVAENLNESEMRCLKTVLEDFIALLEALETELDDRWHDMKMYPGGGVSRQLIETLTPTS